MADGSRQLSRNTTPTWIRKEHGNVSELDFVSPVASGALSASGGGIALEDLSDRSKVLVRAGRSTAAGTHLKVTYGHSRRRRDGTLICGSRPDEWTLIADPGQGAELLASLPDEGFVSVVDITHGRAMFRLSGPDSVDVLAKVCNIDLADDMTPDGAVFSASVAKVTCDLVRSDVADRRTYLISCERSFGRFLFAAIADACAEFGIDVPEDISMH
jgi:heterotetrameric sarcosine oxidase gamma subunit